MLYEVITVTRENVRKLLKDPGSLALREFLITSGQSGKSLGLKPDWVAAVISAVGRITSYNVCYTKLLRTKIHMRPTLWFSNEIFHANFTSNKWKFFSQNKMEKTDGADSYKRKCSLQDSI